ncbi:MAG TPA: sulfite reductase subunit C [Candidatus Rifleibacterium sp.]|nr:sulfite reductase subunit C [Candidatus Rifleibacterium sp.]HPT48012.1 sulfite reductase subunit C [Candidatus Rifleibacterium sp.]
MSLDLNRKVTIKNAFRITKRRNHTAIRIRVPGGHLTAAQISLIAGIAEKFGDGQLHITTRQGFEIPNIPFSRMDEVNQALQPLIKELELVHGVKIESPAAGYPAAGMRNIAACIGNRVCPFANTDTTALAQRIEAVVYPNDFHTKIAVTGCPNDCIKAHMQDFGIIGLSIPEYEYDQCIGCEACAKACQRKVTGALQMNGGKVVRDDRRCIGCGECVLACPTSAWTRKPGKFYRLVIMGRTGKKNPRLAMPFLDRVTEEVITRVIINTMAYVDRHILRCLPKEHIGYIVDRTGFNVFRDSVLEGVTLNPEARIAKTMQWPGYYTMNDANMKSPL